MIAVRKYRFMDSRIGEQFGDSCLKIVSIVRRHRENGTTGMGQWLVQCEHCGRKYKKWASAEYGRSLRCRTCQPPWNAKHTPVQAARVRVLQRAEKSGIAIDRDWLNSEEFSRVFLDKPRGNVRFGVIDVALGVVAGNVGWYRAGQKRMRSHRMYSVAGVTKTLTGWSDICGVTRERMRQRFNKYTPQSAVLVYPLAVAYLKEHGDMAQVVKEFPRTGLEKYFDGQVWELTKGEDYDCEFKTFQGRLRFEASKCGKKVKIRNLENKVWVQAVAK